MKSGKQKKKSDFNPEEYRKILFLEAVRAAMLDELNWKDDAPRSEEETLIGVVWYLLNPLGLEQRGKVERTVLAEEEEPLPGYPPTPPRERYFTAHAHPNEPLTPSPDDLMIYNRLDLEHGAGVNYIVDGFKVKKIKNK